MGGPSSAPIVHWQCVASGRVQGVNYRARVALEATRHGVAGYVENRPDGTVLIDAQGEESAVLAFLRAVEGPHALSDARSVRRMADLPIRADLTGFDIRRE